jgi:hypothetical protein
MPANKRRTRMPISSVTWLLAVLISSAIVLFAMLYWVMHSYLMHEVDERLRGEVAEHTRRSPHCVGRLIGVTKHYKRSRGLTRLL